MFVKKKKNRKEKHKFSLFVEKDKRFKTTQKYSISFQLSTEKEKII